MPVNMFYGARPSTFKNAKQLRLKTTKHEKILWDCLRGNKLGGFRFKRQHPIAGFIADFYCHKASLVIEVDGASHKTQLDYDENRTLILEEFGLSVIRFSNDEVKCRLDYVLETIRKEIAHRTPLP